jgi:hypothetical protein
MNSEIPVLCTMLKSDGYSSVLIIELYLQFSLCAYSLLILNFNTKGGFLMWSITLRITGFLDFLHRPEF